MPIRRLQEFLDENGIRYVTVTHSPAFTAQEIAASAHIPGRELAKTIMVKLDGKMAMAVLPASHQVDLDRIAEAAGATRASMASEGEFRSLFPECELGAMPPFGNLYGLPVLVAEKLVVEGGEIAFNAGSHIELVQMQWRDFERLVQPTVVRFAARV
ncbi:MAG: YbaK/EbsC family protein [Candidatus Eiseniibacteriota bacterium]|jgi:Ala-tRNA(Pro) deacylase